MERISFPPSTSSVPSPEFRERTQIRLPSLHAQRGGEGSGAGGRSAGTHAEVEHAGPQLRWTPHHPRPLPATRKGRVGGGEFKSGVRLAGTTIVSDSNFKQRICVCILAARFRPSCALSLRKGGSRECRMRVAPAVSCANMCERKRTRAYRFSGGTPAFPAQWLYGL